MKLAALTIRVKKDPGLVKVKAYRLGQGLYLHYDPDDLPKRPRRKLGRKWRSWTISVASGMSLVLLRPQVEGYSFRDILKASRTLKRINWRRSLTLGPDSPQEELKAFERQGRAALRRFQYRLTLKGAERNLRRMERMQ